MSYIPDYREETDKLNEVDRACVAGYRIAMQDVQSFFDNFDDEESLSIEKEIRERIKNALTEWLEGEEIMLVCSLFDNADYLPDDIKLVDANEKLFNSKREEQKESL